MLFVIRFILCIITYCFQGLLINWDTQKEIWDVAFGTATSPKDSHVLITEPSIIPDSVREVQNEMLFEEYGFKAMYTTSGTSVKHTND